MSSNSKQPTEEEFGRIRKLIWPIHNYELKKFLPLSLIMFCILFNYTLLRDTKDALVVNASGASSLTFLKLWCVTPCAVLFVVLYAKLLNVFKREHVFYIVVTPFLIFFGLFAFVLQPNVHLIHPTEALAPMYDAFPRMSGFFDIAKYWSYSLFYVLAEIWGSAMLALMFWQFANQIVRIREAKRFYGLFGLVGNVSLIMSGLAVHFCSQDIKHFFPELPAESVWNISLKLLMACVIAVGIAAMLIYRWMNTSVLTDPRFYDGDEAAGVKKKKSNAGLIESLKVIIKSPELGLIAILIVAYGVSINLVEIQWKDQIKMHFAGDKGAYNGFMGLYSTFTGIFTMFFILFIGSNILRAVSWFKAAVVTPLVILLGGSLFFAFVLSSKNIPVVTDLATMILDFVGTNPVAAATFLGAGIVILSKSVKYSLFDPTKEMAYMPLDDELRTKGKAAVDVIGGRAGKAGGAGIQWMLFTLLGTTVALDIASICFIVFAIVCGLWVYAVKGLSVKVAAAVDRKSKEAAQAAATASAGATPTTTAQTA